MNKRTVAIIGRSNVGKSTLVNRLIGRREAIVEDRPGVTRDRVIHEANWAGRDFLIMDTGGWDNKVEGLDKLVTEAAEFGAQIADAIIFIADVRTGVTKTDEALIRTIRRATKPVLLVVNKVDSEALELEAAGFWNLGLGEPFPVSALHGRGAGDLLDKLIEILNEADRADREAFVAKWRASGRAAAGSADSANTASARGIGPDGRPARVPDRIFEGPGVAGDGAVSDAGSEVADSLGVELGEMGSDAGSGTELNFGEMGGDAGRNTAPMGPTTFAPAHPASSTDDSRTSTIGNDDVVALLRSDVGLQEYDITPEDLLGGDFSDSVNNSGCVKPDPPDPLNPLDFPDEADLADMFPPEIDPPRLAIVGRPNVGKSSLLNQLAHNERAVVSEVSGTTRDPIDEIAEIGGELFRLVDTAGIRRRVHLIDGADYYASLRTGAAIHKSDLCLVVIDVSENIAVQDLSVVNQVVESGRALVLVFNKWDRMQEMNDMDGRRELLEREIEQDLNFCTWAPRVNLSAKTGWHTNRLSVAINNALNGWATRIPTSELNSFLGKLVAEHPHPIRGGKQPRILFGTQVSTCPPRFVMFANGFLEHQYRRFIERRLRETYGFEGSPIEISVKIKEKRRK